MVCLPLSMMFPLSNKSTKSAFSLVEVVIAIGIFSLVIVAVVGLLIPITRDTTAVTEVSTSLRLAEGVNRELERVGGTIVSGLGVNSLYLVATPDGARILRTQQTTTGGSPAKNATFPAENDLEATPANPVPGIAKRDRFFLIEVRLLKNDPGISTDNIYFQVGDGAVPVEVRVTWPFYTPIGPEPASLTGLGWNDSTLDGELTPAASRSIYLFAAAVRR